MLGALGSPMPCCAYPHCAVKMGKAAMKFRGLPSCQFLPALKYLLSLEACRGENQCTEQKFLLATVVPGWVWKHAMRALPLLLARLTRQQTFEWYQLSLCPTGSRQAWRGMYQGVHSVLVMHAVLLYASKALSRWAR